MVYKQEKSFFVLRIQPHTHLRPFFTLEESTEWEKISHCNLLFPTRGSISFYGPISSCRVICRCYLRNSSWWKREGGKERPIRYEIDWNWKAIPLTNLHKEVTWFVLYGLSELKCKTKEWPSVPSRSLTHFMPISSSIWFFFPNRGISWPNTRWFFKVEGFSGLASGVPKHFFFAGTKNKQ